MSNRAQWAIVGTVLGALGGLLVLGVAFGSDIGRVGPGSAAPPFAATDVITGSRVTLADFEYQVVLLNVWATWCKPCGQEMPSMQRLYEALGPAELEIVAVSIDTDPADKVRAWVEERGLTFDLLHDPGGRSQRVYQTTGVLESMLIPPPAVVRPRRASDRLSAHRL